MTPEELQEIKALLISASEGVERHLLASMNDSLKNLNEKIDATAKASDDIQVLATNTFANLPAMLQERVEKALNDNVKGIIEQIGKQNEEQFKELMGGVKAGGENGGGGGLTLQNLLAQSDKLMGLVNAWRTPTTEQATAVDIDRIFNWHRLLSKLEKGGGTSDDLNTEIKGTFIPKKPE